MKHTENIEVLPPVPTFIQIAGSISFLVLSIMSDLGAVYLVFSGLCTIIAIHPFLQPGSKVIFEGTKKHRRYLEELQREWREDPGIFNYVENGFLVEIDDTHYSVLWNDITAIYGYAEYGIICIDIVISSLDIFSFTEVTDGWCILHNELTKRFPFPDTNLHERISGDEFKESLTCLYEIEKSETIHHYYYGGDKEQSFDPDGYPFYRSEAYTRLE